MTVWPWTVISDPRGTSSSAPAASKRMTYCPVSVNNSRPKPAKLRLIVATSLSCLSFSQKSHAKNCPLISANCSKVLSRGRFWNRSYFLLHGCQILSSERSS